jgi:very-short-patch-repair endonuclease
MSVLENAKYLRSNMTDAEKLLWSKLRAGRFSCKFRRQAPIGPYITDFVSFTHKLIIELDGGHHAEADQLAYDRLRQQHLEGEGFRVLCFWNHEVLGEMEAVLGRIDEAIMNA